MASRPPPNRPPSCTGSDYARKRHATAAVLRIMASRSPQPVGVRYAPAEHSATSRPPAARNRPFSEYRRYSWGRRSGRGCALDRQRQFAAEILKARPGPTGPGKLGASAAQAQFAEQTRSACSSLQAFNALRLTGQLLVQAGQDGAAPVRVSCRPAVVQPARRNTPRARAFSGLLFSAASCGGSRASADARGARLGE